MGSLFTTAPCLDTCNPIQILNLNMAFNNIDNIKIYDNCNNEYSFEDLQIAYSLDNICWSCYMDYNSFLTNTIELDSDFYIRFKVSGIIGRITIDGIAFTDYSTSIDSGFNFSYCSTSTSSNLYSPYSNMDCAISLQQQMVENVACMFGIPIYYFKLSPEFNSADLTFKEYTLMNVESVKQIKMIIVDNQMPSSKPEFNDWGLDWQTDWETEISKGMFATAFGPTAQPMEGDLIYVPMMKRMWMVNGAYEEKKDAFMWNSTTFKVTLVKYQQKDSVDLGFTEEMVNSFVKNTYGDLFGDNENLGSNESNTEAPIYKPDNLYNVAESDAFRKYVSTSGIDFKNEQLYYKGTMIADDKYSMSSLHPSTIIYQKKYCGVNATISFIITPFSAMFSGPILNVAGIQINIEQIQNNCSISLLNIPDLSLTISTNDTWFIYLRYSTELNIVEFGAAKYVHYDMPIYKLQNHHFWFDIDNKINIVKKYDLELEQSEPGNIILHNFNGEITNIKVFNEYINDESEILMMYPTNSHLLINDTARKLIAFDGFINK